MQQSLPPDPDPGQFGQCTIIWHSLGKPQKKLSFSGPGNKRGGGGLRAWPLKKIASFKKNPMATKLIIIMNKR